MFKLKVKRDEDDRIDGSISIEIGPIDIDIHQCGDFDHQLDGPDRGFLLLFYFRSSVAVFGYSAFDGWLGYVK